MLTWSLPRSLADLLAGFRPCFTAPTFRVFQAMVTGLVAHPGLRTVTGMLTGARLAGVWQHARAHRFFSAARWSADTLGLGVCELVVARLLDPAAPICLVVDDSLFKRTGRKVFGAGWHYDAAATGRKRTAWGNNWVVVGVLVVLPFVAHRQVCLPVLARLWQPRQPGRGKLDLAGELVSLIAGRYPDRRVHLVGDAAYAGKTLRRLPKQVTVTTRLRADAALYALPGPRQPGQRGRPRVKGERLPELIVLAALAAIRWQQTPVRCYGQTRTKELASLVCLWPTVFGAQPVRVGSCARPARPTAPSGGGADCPVRAAVCEPGRLLVCDARPARPGRGRPPRPRALVPAQARGLVRRHADRAPARHHRCPLSARSPARAHPSRTPPSPGSLGRHRRMNRETREIEGPESTPWPRLIG